jgi:3D (Asp-Asp-Asp) domain-containing protein
MAIVTRVRTLLGALVATLAVAPPSGAVAAGGAGVSGSPGRSTAGGPSGGAAPGALAPNPAPPKVPPPPSKHAHGFWLRGVTVTEYWPAPESWFVGRLVTAPGLPGKHRIDWLYSAQGLSMEGQGFGLDGRMYHIDSLGDGGWVTRSGQSTDPGNGWSAGAPYWRAGGFWRGPGGGVTFPLAAGGWSAGAGRRYVALPGVTFAAGASLPIHFYQSIAVDPQVIPLGSRVYIPAYRNDGYGGWFIAQDTGGAIIGRRIDVYRSPPQSPTNGGQYLVNQPAFVIKSAG